MQGRCLHLAISLDGKRTEHTSHVRTKKQVRGWAFYKADLCLVDCHEIMTGIVLHPCWRVLNEKMDVSGVGVGINGLLMSLAWIAARSPTDTLALFCSVPSIMDTAQIARFHGILKHFKFFSEFQNDQQQKIHEYLFKTHL